VRRHTRSRGRSAIAALALISYAGCAGTATIVRTDSPNNEAEIVRSDPTTLYVAGANGRVYRLGHESVRDIDHPGNVEILIGGILFGIGGAYFAGGLVKPSLDYRTVGLVYAVPGLILILTGLYKYLPSIRAARAFEQAPSTIAPRPLLPGPPLPAAPPPPILVPYPPPPAAAPPPPPVDVNPPPAAPPPADQPGAAGADR